MHKVQAKAILSAKNGMNIYRGCQHGCIYCDARSTCYQMNHVFEDIEVKENAPQLLEAALKRKRKKCMIGTGAMSDPYMPLEMELNLTRQCAELIERYGFGLTVLTKSDNVLRDLDLFCRINAKTKWCHTDDTDDYGRCTQPENRTGCLHNRAADRGLKHFKGGRYSDRGMADTVTAVY